MSNFSKEISLFFLFSVSSLSFANPIKLQCPDVGSLAKDAYYADFFELEKYKNKWEGASFNYSMYSGNELILWVFLYPKFDPISDYEDKFDARKRARSAIYSLSYIEGPYDGFLTKKVCKYKIDLGDGYAYAFTPKFGPYKDKK